MDKLPQKSFSDLLQKPSEPEKPKPVTGPEFERAQEFDRTKFDNLKIGFWNSVWYGLAKAVGVIRETVQTVDEIAAAIRNLKQLALLVVVVLVLIGVLYFLAR